MDVEMPMSENLTRAKFTNLNKVLFPLRGVTKAQVIEYYIRVAPMMLGILADRPIVMNRFPEGVDREGFYEKDAPAGSPSWVTTFGRYSETSKRIVNYVLCNDLDTLLWMANLAALEIHITLSRAGSFETPDLVLFDIDPEPPANFDDVVDVSLLLKEKLDSMGLRTHVKTSGKKGLHVVVPISGEHTFSQTREFVHRLGRDLTRESGKIVSEFSRSREPGKVFIDYLQNGHGRTMACPYSLRATPGATVSTPLDWGDVRKGLNPEDFDLYRVMKSERDPWGGLLQDRQRLEAD